MNSMELIYKIVPVSSWREAEAIGFLKGTPADLADGFIHLSNAGQIRETAEKYFAGQDGLLLIAVNAIRLGESLRFEPSRGGALFPHLYAPLPVEAAVFAKPLPLLEDGRHDFSCLSEQTLQVLTRPCEERAESGVNAESEASGPSRFGVASDEAIQSTLATPGLLRCARNDARSIKLIGMSVLEMLVRPILFALDPERAHKLAIWALKTFPLPQQHEADTRLAVHTFGLNFPNPLGLAAGFDKDGEIAGPILRLGFGFTEVGTVTPCPQPGNPRPRLFRLSRDEALINRLGFCGDGFAAVHKRLGRRGQAKGIVGINIGASKNSPDRVDDYVRGIEAFADAADYFTINVSSPNTPGLRDLQQPGALGDLLARVLAARDAQVEKFGYRPVLLKISPDLSLPELDAVIACARAQKIDGMIVSNSTVTRPASLTSPAASEQGGLSGKPLFALSTQMLAAAFIRIENQFPLIGTGGVDSAETAFAKIEAGASLVQLCTAFVFRGVTIATEINRGLLRLLGQKSYRRLSDARGTAAADWARGKVSPDNVR
jgi:dihydroorotate dehydrogenase